MEKDKLKALAELQKSANPLMNEINVVPGVKPVANTAQSLIKGVTQHFNPNEVVGVVKGVTDHINTNDVQKVLSGNQFQNKLAAILESRAASKAAKLAGQAGKMMSGVAKHIPVFGGLAVGLGTALATGDASAGEQAATPLLNEADPLGPSEGTLEYKLESGSPMTPEEMQILKNRHM